jgi:thioredoxin reductase
MSQDGSLVYDVIIIGGSYAGLAAALQLARARRRVLVLDAGQRRNRFASHSHGFLGQDGRPPGVIAATGRAEVLTYPTVTWREGLATEALGIPGGFAVRAGSDEHRGKRLILATGVVDELPAVPGLAERWGKTVFSCPYCDGYEFDLGRLAVLATNPSSPHFAVLVSEWAAPGQMTLFVNGGPEPDPTQLAELATRDILVEREPILHITGEAPGLELCFRDGRKAKLDGLFLHPSTTFKIPFAEQLGCELEMGALGPIYKTDANKETTVPGVFACGDVALPKPAVAFAVADGVRAGAGAHQSLVFGARAAPES